MVRPLVLVVEDEAVIRLNATMMLEDAGFETVEAPTAGQAIRHLEINSRIQIVFTDINLPGSMDGLRLAAAIRSRWPPVELVLTSGRVLVAEKDMPARSLFLPKPYSSQQLIQIMHSFDRR